METLLYLIKVNVAISLLYSTYRLFLQGDTFFRWKRFVLLSIAAVAFLYPLLTVSERIVSSESFANRSSLPVYYLNEIVITVGNAALPSPLLTGEKMLQLALALYGAVTVFLLVRIILQIFAVLLLVQKTPTALRGKVHVKKELQAPFSFFAWIVLDPEKYSESELKEILLHEETHVRQGHSLDMILSEILCALCWLNPFAWLLKKEMRMNLEYLADHTVLNSGCEVKHYQLHLLRLSYTKAAATITNNFNVSPLKKRIVMMNRKKTSLASIWKYALLAPAFVLLALFNDSLKAKAQTPALAADATGTAAFVSGGNPDVAPEVEAENVQQTPQESEKASEKKVVKFTPPPPPKIVKAAKNSAQKEVFNEAEEMPQFPGGQNALMKYLSGNTKYPEAAIRDSIQGRVVVRFIIDATGKIDSVNIVKSLNATCDAEAIRVVKAMPTWIPGKNKGEAVSVAYTVPIIYKFK